MMYSIMYSVKVSLNEIIKQGAVIGFKNKVSSNYENIMFPVSISGKEADARDYLIRSEDH